MTSNRESTARGKLPLKERGNAKLHCLSSRRRPPQGRERPNHAWEKEEEATGEEMQRRGRAAGEATLVVTRVTLLAGRGRRRRREHGRGGDRGAEEVRAALEEGHCHIQEERENGTA